VARGRGVPPGLPGHREGMKQPKKSVRRAGGSVGPSSEFTYPGKTQGRCRPGALDGKKQGAKAANRRNTLRGPGARWEVSWAQKFVLPREPGRVRFPKKWFELAPKGPPAPGPPKGPLKVSRLKTKLVMGAAKKWGGGRPPISRGGCRLAGSGRKNLGGPGQPPPLKASFRARMHGDLGGTPRGTKIPLGGLLGHTHAAL